MKRQFCVAILLLVLTGARASDLTHGKYGRDFLDHGAGARYLGMGSAAVSHVNDISAIYWNPAGLGRVLSKQIHAMHDERFAGAVNWDFVGGGLPLSADGTLGFGFFRSGVDQVPLTRLRDPSRGLGDVYVDEEGRLVINDPYAYDWINQQEMAFVVSLGRKRSETLYYGASVRVLRKTMDRYSAWGLGFDVGAQWNPWRALWLGGMLSDATTTLLAWEGGNKEYFKPRLTLGASYLVDAGRFTFRPAVDLRNSLDNMGGSAQFHAGRLDMDLGVGLEVRVMRIAALRLGSFRGDLTGGAGFNVGRLALDYGFSSSSDLGDSHRISIAWL